MKFQVVAISIQTAEWKQETISSEKLRQKNKNVECSISFLAYGGKEKECSKVVSMVI